MQCKRWEDPCGNGWQKLMYSCSPALAPNFRRIGLSNSYQTMVPSVSAAVPRNIYCNLAQNCCVARLEQIWKTVFGDCILAVWTQTIFWICHGNSLLTVKTDVAVTVCKLCLPKTKKKSDVATTFRIQRARRCRNISRIVEKQQFCTLANAKVTLLGYAGGAVPW